ncbi:MAG: N-6 DNA methylase [Planctomycetes bacterium]|nr:N-6 DNA methylase [Planctomycetota bacterium]
MAKRKKSPDTEVDAYVFIKENLKALGWDTRNPERAPEGQVWTQNECLGHPEIKRLLGLKRPENIVKVTEKVLWVIEAKRSQKELHAALTDAYGRVAVLNQSKQFQVKFVSGVAGNSIDGFIIRTEFVQPDGFKPITWNDVAVTGLLGLDDLQLVLKQGSPDVENPKFNEKLFLSRANAVNDILHLGAVNPHQRAGVMAALLLAMLSDTGPNVEERSPTVLIGDINSRVKSVLTTQGKPEFYDYIRIALPSTSDNHVKFRQALIDTIQELNNLNIKSAMNSGDDWLGAFYEVFLKYASWAQDLGIVLTPRHLTQWAAAVVDVQSNDIVYDPTCGTGGFLVAAFDHVKQRSNATQLDRFKQYCLFGVEQETGVAALAVVNMIFRGDGKNNIKEGNCFAQFLSPHSRKGTNTAKYVKTQSKTPPITKVMMNPPFSLKGAKDKEYKFVDQALAQMEDGGILFAVLPYPAMCKPKGYDTWRRDVLLPKHTLLAVVSFPSDVFYPIGVTTVGVFIKKGIPHPPQQNVLWVRAPGDGFLKSKGKRLPNPKATNELAAAEPILKAFLRDTSHPVRNALQFHKATPIDFEDVKCELVPEVYLDQAKPEPDELFAVLEEDLRNLLAYLVKLKQAKLEETTNSSRKAFGKTKWKSFRITELFELGRGHFHSIAALDSGTFPTISRVSTDNGCVGFYDIPAGASVWPARAITVSSVTGDAFVQPVPFIATDNVVLCIPRPEYASLRLSSLVFIQAMMNHMKWRYSYGRQCYKGKYAKTEIWLPVTKGGKLNEKYMANMVGQANHWSIIEASVPDA